MLSRIKGISKDILSNLFAFELIVPMLGKNTILHCFCCVVRFSKKKFRRVDLYQDQYGRLHWDISTLDTAIGGERYFCVLLDERSRYLWVECFKRKRSVADWTSSKLREISREASKVGLGIVSLRADNGSEVPP
jgi:hypothetical protein